MTRGDTPLTPPEAVPEAVVAQPQAMPTHNLPPVVAEPVTQPRPKPTDLASNAPQSPAEAGTFALEDLAPDTWCHLLELLGLGGIVYNIASHCELRSRESDSLEFILDADNASLFNDGHSDKMRMALENYFGRSLSVNLTQGAVQRETPAVRTARLVGERQQEAVIAIEGDPQLQALIARFDGELDRSSIVPTDV